MAFPRLHKTFTTDRGRPYTDTSFVIPPGILKSSQPIGDDPNLCMALNLSYRFVCYSYEEAREIQTVLLFAGSIHLVTWTFLRHDASRHAVCQAGYPQEALNEIHGSWFDPSNPVAAWLNGTDDSWGLRWSQPRKVPGWTVRTGFWMFLLAFFLGPNGETLFLMFLGEYFREQCRGFFKEPFLIGTVSTGFPGKYLGNFSGVFLRDLPANVWTLGNFLRNVLGDLLGEHPRGDFWRELPGWFFWELDLAWTSLGTCDPPNITVIWNISSFILPYLSIRPWKFPHLKVHFRAELRPENFAQLSEIQEFFLHSAGAKLLYAAVQNAAHFCTVSNTQCYPGCQLVQRLDFFTGVKVTDQWGFLTLIYSNSLCIHANNCPKGDQRTITNPVRARTYDEVLG